MKLEFHPPSPGVIPCKFHPDADAVALVREFPEAGTSVGPERRRVLVARFPYSIVYRQDADAIVIVAVAHQRRRPGYWRRRN